VTFGVYLGIVAAVTIVPTRLARYRSLDTNHVNVVPFQYSFRCYVSAWRIHHDLKTFCLRNTLGNIALFLPLGILLPLLGDRYRSLIRVVLVASCLSLSIETIQFLLRFIGNPRAVDIDDVILNTLGACLGFVFYKYGIPNKEKSSRNQKH
jgi:glycopeptide antibiotics resistance protein